MTRRPDPVALAGQILASAKYRHLDEAFVARMAAEAAHRFRDHTDAEKYARRKLHQAFGAFLTGPPGEAVRGCVRDIRAGVPVRDACRSAMRAHASTAERLDWLDPMYERITSWCGPVGSVVDLACGLNPLALPWLPLAPGARYRCCDVDRDLVAALSELGTVFPVEVSAHTCDLAATPEAAPDAEVALLLKTLPTLEQQRAGACAELLSTLDCMRVVLSVPLRSLSGRLSYVEDPLTVVDGTPYRLADRAVFGDELVCHLVRDG